MDNLTSTAIGIVVLVIVVVAGIVALLELKDTSVVAASADANTSIDDGIAGITLLIVFVSVIAIVVSIAFVIAVLRKLNDS